MRLDDEAKTVDNGAPASATYGDDAGRITGLRPQDPTAPNHRYRADQPESVSDPHDHVIARPAREAREGQQLRRDHRPFAVDEAPPPKAAPAPHRRLVPLHLLHSAAGRHRLRIG